MGLFLSRGVLVYCRFFVRRCVQVRLAYSAGDNPAGVHASQQRRWKLSSSANGPPTASSKRYLGKGTLADQVARHERKITPGVIPFGGTLLQGCCHSGAAFGPEFPSCGKQPGRDRLDPPFARPQWLQKLLYSLAGFEPRGEGLEFLLPAD
jgi:hypothetical protein